MIGRTMTPLAASAPSGSDVPPAAVTHGAALTFETVGTFDVDSAPLRLRPLEDSLLRVIDGALRLTVDGEERVLQTGEEAIVPAGASHRLEGVAGLARFVMGFRCARAS
jgi:mannose-6-phosphate isomerase-like protein (cupin superfamily)